MLSIILEATIRSTILVIAVLVGTAGFRIRNPRIQSASWRMVLIASLAMPFLIGWTSLNLAPTGLSFPQIVSEDFVSAVGTPAAPLNAVDASPSVDWKAIATTMYGAVVALLLLRLVVGLALAWNLCRSATPLRDDWTDGRDVRISTSVTTPVTFGSIVLLPDGYTAWTSEQRRAVVAHEAAHVDGGDFYFSILAAINRAIFWINPLSWWMSGRIAYLAELVSDAAAIESINDRLKYAEILIGFARKTDRSSFYTAMARPNTVRLRVEAILARSVFSSEMNWKTWCAILAVIVPLTGIAACVVAQTPSEGVQAGALDADSIAQLRREQSMPRQKVEIDPQILDGYVGYYELSSDQVFAVTRNEDHLVVRLTNQAAFDVYPESAQKFFYKTIYAQISFITDRQGRATGLVLHQNGFETPAKRVDQATAQNVADRMARKIHDAAATPGSEGAIRRQIKSLEGGEGLPVYGDMTEKLAAITVPQVPKIKHQFTRLGRFQSISFRGVGSQGWDVYETKFEGGIAIWRIKLAPDGKISGLLIQWGP